VFTKQTAGDVRTVAADLAWARDSAVAKNSDYCVRFYDTYYEIFNSTTCGTAANRVKNTSLVSFVSRSNGFGQWTDPITSPIEIVFYTASSTRIAGQALCPSGSYCNITLSHVNNWKNVTVFEDTGYLKIIN
jgi:hypothetical protein